MAELNQILLQELQEVKQQIEILKNEFEMEKQKPKIIDLGEFKNWEVYNSGGGIKATRDISSIVHKLYNPVIQVSVVGKHSHWVLLGTNSVYYNKGDKEFSVFLQGKGATESPESAAALLNIANQCDWRVQYVIFDKP